LILNSLKTSITHKMRILAVAPHANPHSVATSLVGYAQCDALARHHSVTLAVRCEDLPPIMATRHLFARVEGVSIAALDRLYAWSIRWIFKGNYGSQALTAFSYPFGVAFELLVWLRFRARIMAGDFDVVLRVLPVSSVQPSPLAWLLRRGPVPLVLGPVNGGLPWPTGFPQAERQREWITGLRTVYRFLPFARSTFREAAAILAGSSNTFAEFSKYNEKMFLVPENGIESAEIAPLRASTTGQPLQLAFVGRLVPYKACDLAIRGAALLLRDNRAHLTIVGDGPERGALQELATRLGIAHQVSFAGWLSHPATVDRLRRTDVFVFPSVREFGGGVVFEALAAGAVPIVAAFGGPGDIVHQSVGFRVPLVTPDQVVTDIAQHLSALAADRNLLKQLSDNSIAYAREHLTWDAKARVVSDVLSWVVGIAEKPRRAHFHDGPALVVSGVG
jgi:glycosyltransferase involved in cell wall biosynthesis